MIKRIVLFGFILALFIAAAGYYYVFIYSVKHKRDVRDEKAIAISAKALSAAFNSNEQSANVQFLNKAIEVRGAVLSIAQDQSKQKTLLMGSEMALSNVFITLKDSTISFKIGDTIQVKAICSGFLSDVVLVDGVIQH